VELLVAVLIAAAAVAVAAIVLGHRQRAVRVRGPSELDAKKQLIDVQLAAMRDELGRVTELVASVERERSTSFGRLSEQLRQATSATSDLVATTQTLRDALASTRARGQWGERMAEDVLRAAGFVEGINYVTQTATPHGSIPDFTFPLPGRRCVHMDVKFPLDNYLRALDADRDEQRAACTKTFLRDVRNRIDELHGRGYVDPSRGTLDYVLLFIPNEQVYGFVHEHDPTLLDHALRAKVVLCSPVTLFAVLAVIRQAVDNFALEATSNEILEALGRFGRQWEAFTEQMEKVGTRLDQARQEYDAMVGTRRRALDRPLEEIDELRRQRGAGLAETAG